MQMVPAGVKFQRIGQIVDQDLLDPTLVRHHDEMLAHALKLDLQAQAQFVHAGSPDARNGVQPLAQIDRGEAQIDLAGLDLGDVQGAVQQAQQHPPGLGHVVDHGGLGLGSTTAAQHLGQAQDDVQGGADLVADHGQEAGLGPVGPFGGGAVGLGLGQGGLKLARAFGQGHHQFDRLAIAAPLAPGGGDDAQDEHADGDLDPRGRLGLVGGEDHGRDGRRDDGGGETAPADVHLKGADHQIAGQQQAQIVEIVGLGMPDRENEQGVVRGEAEGDGLGAEPETPLGPRGAGAGASGLDDVPEHQVEAELEDREIGRPTPADHPPAHDHDRGDSDQPHREHVPVTVGIGF